MKQLLLVISLSLTAWAVSAQDTLWLEDFSDGLVGWEISTDLCGDNTGPGLGTYALNAAIVGGMIFEFEEGSELIYSFLNVNEYTVSYHNADNSEYVTVYSTYSVTDGVMDSAIDPTMLVADGTAFVEEETDGIVTWAANMNIAPETLPIWQAVIGSGDPMLTVIGDGAQINLTDAASVTQLIFDRIDDCGRTWIWSPNGNYGYGSFNGDPGTVIDSDTRTNGNVMFNAMYQNSLGDPDYNPGGPPYPPHFTELTSPNIDISGSDVGLEVQMFQAMRFLNTNASSPGGFRTAISFSADGGETWTDYVDANNTLVANQGTEGLVTHGIPTSLTADADSIRIRFSFGADFYIWAIDDVVVKERPLYDMQVNENFFAVTPNIITPASQTVDVGFIADIQNNGIQTAEDVILNLTVADEMGNEIFNEDKAYGDIIPDSIAENDFFSTQMLAADQVPGFYTGTYLISHSEPDVVNDNDTLTFDFLISDTLFSKDFTFSRNVAPADDNSFYYGNCYFTPNGDGFYARWLSFSVSNAQDIFENGSGAVTTYLYEWDGDLNDNGEADPEEYNFAPIAFNSYSFDGSEDDQLITIPIDLDAPSNGGIPLQDDKYYLAMVQYTAAGADDDMFINANSTVDYSAMAFYTDSISNAQGDLLLRQYAAVLEVGGAADPSFSTVGFGRNLVPLVRLSIGQNPDIYGDPLVGVDDPLPAEYGMKLYPNPTRELFTMEIEMPEVVNEATVRIFDPAGRMHFQQSYQDIRQGRFDYDVSQLAAGIYFVQLSTSEGYRTERLIIER